MKAWKKLSFLLCLTFSFTTVATSCDGIADKIGGLIGGESSTESSIDLGGSDDSSDVSSNVGGNEGGNQGGNEGGNQGGNQGGNEGGNQGGNEGGNQGDNKPLSFAETVDLLAETVSNGLEGVQSAKMDFSFVYDYAAATNVVMTMNGSAIATATDDGMDMKLDVTMENNAGSKSYALYLCDYVLYIYNVDDSGNSTLGKDPIDLEEKLDTAISEATDGEYTLASMGVTLEEVLNELTGTQFPGLSFSDIWDETAMEGITTKSTVGGGSINVSMDVAEVVDKYMSTFDGLTMQSSMTDVIDCVLAQVNPELTMSSIFMEIIKLGPVKMNEVYNTLTTLLEVSPQVLWEVLVADETVYAALVEVFGEEKAAEIKAFNIEAFLLKTDSATGKTYGELTFNDLIEKVSKGKYASVALFVGFIESELNKVKLSNVDKNGIIAKILPIMQAGSCTIMETAVGTKHTENGDITEVTWNTRCVILVNEEDTLTLTGAAIVSEFNPNPVAITLPEASA